MRFYLPTRTYDNIDAFENDLGTSYLLINVLNRKKKKVKLMAIR